MVTYNAHTYIAILANNASTPPPVSDTKWQVLARGVRWRGSYSALTLYYDNDAVVYNGASYISLTDSHSGNAPTGGGQWQEMARKGTDGTTGADGADGADGVDAFAPVGMMVMTGSSSAPTGWLFCRGQAVSRSTYSDLYAAIGTTYGYDTGSDFNLPDLRARLPMGQSVAGVGGPNNVDHSVQSWANTQTDRTADDRLTGEILLTKGQIPELDTSIAADSGYEQGGSLKWEIMTRASSTSGSRRATPLRPMWISNRTTSS